MTKATIYFDTIEITIPVLSEASPSTSPEGDAAWREVRALANLLRRDIERLSAQADSAIALLKETFSIDAGRPS